MQDLPHHPLPLLLLAAQLQLLLLHLLHLLHKQEEEWLLQTRLCLGLLHPWAAHFCLASHTAAGRAPGLWPACGAAVSSCQPLQHCQGLNQDDNDRGPTKMTGTGG